MASPPRSQPPSVLELRPRPVPLDPTAGSIGAALGLPQASSAPMLPDPRLALPTSLLALLAAFRPCFTAPTFATFCALCVGFVAQPARRTVCGMLVGARLSRVWSLSLIHISEPT